MAADLFQPANADELKATFLRDVRLAAIDSGLAEPPTTPGTDWDLLGTAVANIALLGFANINSIESDTNLLTTTGQALEDIRISDGLPEVTAAGGSGKVVVTALGATTITDGQQFVYPNGLRGEVVGTYVNPADQSEVNVTAIDVGRATNLPAGATVRFAPSAPLNVAEEAIVSSGEPITGGTDIETDERKRARILNGRQNKPAGGNWAHLRQIALDALGSVQDCYVYPALGGPGSAKVVPVKDFDPSSGDFSRVLSSSALQVVRLAIQSNVPTPQEIVVESSVDQSADFTILVSIPDSALSGGNGKGWSDSPPWPPLVVGDANAVTVVSVNGTNDVITVSAQTTTAPIAGQTHISWWSAIDRKFRTALIVGVAGGTGAWILTLDHPFVGDTGAGPATGGTADYISPSAQNLDRYGSTWVDIFRALGPGENTADPNLGARSKRHPFATDEDASAITNSALTTLVKSYPEITDIMYGVRSPSSPTVPGSVVTAPNILVPRRFAVYAIT